MNKKGSVRAGGVRGRVVEHAVPWRGDHKLRPALLLVRPLLVFLSTYSPWITRHDTSDLLEVCRQVESTIDILC
jgi:hypothetical protein